MNERQQTDISLLIKQRAEEIRKSPSFNPRKEKELNELYNQYVPPHSTKNTSDLLDIAERDAYIDPFPPLGSQKKGGVVIKKGIRTAIGWYVQYIAQQISTFGSGVSQALRAMNTDIEDLKKYQSDDEVSSLLAKLNLGTVDEKTLNIINNSLTDNDNKIIISDGLEESLYKQLDHSSNVIVVDNNLESNQFIDANLDVRVTTISSFISNVEDFSIDIIFLNGSFEFLPSTAKISLINHCSRSLNSTGKLVIAVRSKNYDMNSDESIALDILGQQLWSPETWSHILADKFQHVEVKIDSDIILFFADNRE